MKQLILWLILFSMSTVLLSSPLWENPVLVNNGNYIDWNRCAASTYDNGMIYVWSDSQSGSRDIYARKVNMHGYDLWAEPILVAHSEYSELWPVITKTSDNAFVIAYSELSGFGESIIKAQKITTSGQIYWQSEGVTICDINQSEYEYELVADNTGGAYILWVDGRNNQSDIYAQRLNGSGVIQWAVNGINFGDSNGGDRLFSATMDGAGGCMLLHTSEYTSSNNVYLKRIESDGEVTWTQQLDSTESYGIHDVMLTSGVNNFFLPTWTSLADDSTKIKAQCVSSVGAILWPAPVSVAESYVEGNNYFSVGDYRIVNTSDNCLGIVWEDYGSYNIYAQKLNLSGELLWGIHGVPVCDSEGDQSNVRITADGSGGLFATWIDYNEGEQIRTQVYAQYLSSMGNRVWQPEGLPICTQSVEARDPMVRFILNRLFVIWHVPAQETFELRLQVVTLGGTQTLQQQGRPLIQRVYSSPYIDGLITCPNGVAVIGSTYVTDVGHRLISYKLLNPDGTVQFEPTGRTLTVSAEEEQQYVTTISTPDGRLAFAWMEGNRVKAQLLSPGGNPLWGENGIVIAEPVGWVYHKPLISYEGGAFYYAYEVMLEQNNWQVSVYTQKVINGLKQWGDTGILLTYDSVDNPELNCYVGTLDGRYYTWEASSYQSQNSYNLIYTKLLNPDGTTAEGWPENGLPLSTPAGQVTFVYHPEAKLTDAGLFVTWTCYFTDDSVQNQAQLVSPQGDLLWGPVGIVLDIGGANVYDMQLVTGPDILISWLDVTEGDFYSIKMQKFNLAGQPVWQPGGVCLNQSDETYHPYYYSATQTPNGGAVVAYTRILVEWDSNYKDVFMRFVNPDGTFASECLPVSTEYDEEEYPQIALLNNEIYVLWQDTDIYQSEDGRCGDEFPYSIMLHAMKFSNEVVAVEDDELPSADIALEQNYPNPFNPETKIGFTLQGSSEVELCIYNLKGQKVKTLHSGLLEKGHHTLIWDGTDAHNTSVSSGVYFYKLSSGKFTSTRKMILLK
jgi:hypothetical protein